METFLERARLWVVKSGTYRGKDPLQGLNVYISCWGLGVLVWDKISPVGTLFPPPCCQPPPPSSYTEPAPTAPPRHGELGRLQARRGLRVVGFYPLSKL